MVWDVKIVLDMFRQWKDNSELTLKELTLKTVTLVELITAQRAQSIHQFDLSTMLKGEQKLAFKLELLELEITLLSDAAVPVRLRVQ